MGDCRRVNVKRKIVGDCRVGDCELGLVMDPRKSEPNCSYKVSSYKKKCMQFSLIFCFQVPIK